MIALFLIGSSTIIVMMVLVIVIGIARAPEGYEDSTGFHHGKRPEPNPARAQRKQERQTELAFGESNGAAHSRITDAIIFVKKQIRVQARLPKPSPARNSAGASAKPRASREDENPPWFGDSNGGTAVSDSNSPFPFPDPAQDGESFDTKP